MSNTVLKPIRSAEAVAALRAASAKESDQRIANPDRLAKRFVSYPYSILLGLPSYLGRRIIEHIAPGGYCYFLSRTRYIDEQLLKAIENGITQVVILGAGYDTRASRFTQELKDATVFEVDLPSTQKVKLERMEAAEIRSSKQTTYIAHDFNIHAIDESLMSNGFRFDKPAFFIWEGVSYYLREKAVQDVFKLVSEQCAKGSCIVFDYALRSFVDGGENTYGAKKIHKWLKKNNEHFHFGINSSELAPYLNTIGLTLKDDIGPEEIQSRFLTRDDGSSVGKPYGHLRMALSANT
jgi:methyltransferase (TIGR00027 family)